MDIELNFIEQGNGEPLILLHGNGEDHTYFSNQIREFSKYFHVYALDTRGHGKSPFGSKAFNLDTLSEDVLDFMDSHNIEKANILGFSDGGNIALIFALGHSDRILKLVVNGANANTKGVKSFFQIPIELSYRLMKPFKKLGEKRKIISLMVGQPDLSAQVLSKIHVPTLIMAGTNDLIKHEHTEFIAKNIPQSELCFISGGHAIARTNPKIYNKTVLNFLGVA